MKNSKQFDALFLDEAHSAEIASQAEVLWKRFMWPIFGLAAILILELTTSITISSFVFCIKFGMSDFALARWFAKNDPVIERRKACVSLQYAMGAFKVVLSGSIMSAVFVVIAATQRLHNNFQTAAAIAGLTALIGLLISCGFSLIGVWAASKAGLRVWVDRSLAHKSLTDFPPNQYQFSGLNELPSLVGALKVMETLLCIILLTVLMIFLPEISYPAIIIFTIILWVYLLCKIDNISSRISATTLEECWSELEPKHEIADDLLEGERSPKT